MMHDFANAISNKSKSLTRHFCENSGFYASRFYGVATTFLLVKNVVTPFITQHKFDLNALNWWDTRCDIVSAFLFYGSSYCYAKAQNDQQFWKHAGPFVVGAGVTVAAGGWRGDITDSSFWVQAGSMAPTILGGVCLWLGKNKWGAFPEFLSRIPHGLAGVMQGDIGQVFFAGACAVGDTAVVVSDKTLNAAIMEATDPNAPAPGS